MTVSSRPDAPPPRKRQRFDEAYTNTPTSSCLAVSTHRPRSVLHTLPPIKTPATSAAPLTVVTSPTITPTHTIAPTPATTLTPTIAPTSATTLMPTITPMPTIAPTPATTLTPTIAPPLTNPVISAIPVNQTAKGTLELAWEPHPTSAVTSLSWDPQECHQIISKSFSNPQHCVLCFERDKLFACHHDQAQRRIACPVYSLEYKPWQAFKSGWNTGQKTAVEAFRVDMVDKSQYGYCGVCLIETCGRARHGCIFANHDREGCRHRQDLDKEWFIRLTFLILRQGAVRKQVARTLIKEDTSSWNAFMWGGWVARPYVAHLSCASVVISLYLQHYWEYI
jgi:hypothetical protein